jgi:Tol biopolymer transport system component
VSTLANAVFAPSDVRGRAHLIYLRGGTLLAQRFQPDYSALEGEPAVLAEGITANLIYGLADFGASFNGILFYGVGGNRAARAVWVGKDGRTLASIDPPGVVLGPRLSPDGSRLIMTRFDPNTGNADLWLVDLARNLSTRFTFDPAYDFDPIWSPDGRETIFTSARGGVFNLYRKPVAASGEERRMTNSKLTQYPMDWSRDGSYVLYMQREASTSDDLWVLPMKDGGTPLPFARTEFSERHGQFSPSGRWIAYDSDETGGYQVYVRAFQPGATGGAKYQLSSTGGSEPRWRGDGKEIYYVSSGGKMMAASVTESPAGLQFGPAKELFDAPLVYANNFSFFYDVTADGQRFLLLSPLQENSAAAYSLIINWPSKLKK